MSVKYDEYYLSSNLFGAPYPALIRYFESIPSDQSVLDVGCGQGRNAIPLAKIGFDVTGLDHSKVGMDQMNAEAKLAGLSLLGYVEDIYSYKDYGNYDILLFDSMFHFLKMDRVKESTLIKTITHQCPAGTYLVYCIQNKPTSIACLYESLQLNEINELILEEEFIYRFKNEAHTSKSPYRMTVVKKLHDTHNRILNN